MPVGGLAHGAQGNVAESIAPDSTVICIDANPHGLYDVYMARAKGLEGGLTLGLVYTVGEVTIDDDSISRRCYCRARKSIAAVQDQVFAPERFRELGIAEMLRLCGCPSRVTHRDLAPPRTALASAVSEFYRTTRCRPTPALSTGPVAATSYLPTDKMLANFLRYAAGERPASRLNSRRKKVGSS
jgi:hypothetical protein